MSADIYITGIGIVSAIGNNADECFDSLKNQKSGISKIKYLDTIHSSDFMAGEVKLTNSELADILQISKSELNQYSRTSLLGLMAAHEAVFNAQIDTKDGKRTAIVSATTVGGMDRTELEFGKSENIDFAYTHPCGDSTDKIANKLHIYDYRTTISTACSSSANAIMHGARLIKNGIVDRAIVGGVDALSKFTLNGFNSLMIFDRELCRPFDDNRHGLNLGEGAGFLVIESEKSLQNKEYICRLTGYANANDAFHQTASSPEGEGAFIAMQNALKMSGLSIDDIDYINAHGTGTENNDFSEGTAIKRLFINKIPAFSSTKAYTGHTLAAAAGIEAVFSAIAISENIIFPNLNFKNPINSLGIIPETEIKYSQNIRNVMSNSFGFGGNDSSLIFSR